MMKKFLCLFLSLLMGFGTAAYAESTGIDPLAEIVTGMSLRDKVAQMMIASFRVWKEVPPEGEAQPEEEPPKVNITELNDEIREMVSRDHFGGILLFAENFADAEQTLRLVSDLQTVNREGGGLPQVFFADQEGGRVNRISYATQGVSNMALGATGDPENARAMAAILGEESGLLGIQADFAPVVDVNNNPANPVIGIRSFSDDPQAVAEFSCAYMAGLHDAGIMAALKHFPGHGNTDTDSHTGFPLINSTYEELQSCELIPFKAAIDAGADMVMTAHIQYPQIEKETLPSVSTGEQVYLPATMSKTILTDILRGDMGFEGVIVTDALDMDAIAKNFTAEDTIKLTVNAGADMLILPAVNDTNRFRLVQDYVDTAAALVESGEIDEKRIDESVLRILKLKQKYGILDMADFAVTEEKIAAAREGVGSEEHRETEWRIAEKALTVYKNENDAFPLDVKAGEKTLILFADSCASRAGAGDLIRQMTEKLEGWPEGAEIATMTNTRDNGEECIRAAVEADHVILVHRVYNLACLNPETDDGFSSGTFDRIIPAVHEAGKTVIVVSCQLPYDAARFPDADAVLLTYWGSAMREIPAEGASWSANLPEGLMACIGLSAAEGVSPVDIPALDDRYMPVKETADAPAPNSAEAEPAADGENPYTLEQVVILSRHNLRAPLTSNGSVPSELTPHSWIQWTANSSELTIKGGVEETSMGQYFRKWLDREGLFPENSVPQEGEVRFNAREKQRCRATARYFAAGLFPLADIKVEYPGGESNLADFMKPALHFCNDAYAEDATAQVAAMGGEAGFSGLAEQNRDVIKLIMDTVDMQDSEIYRSGKYGDLLADDFGYAMEDGKEPDLTGAIKTAYQVADALILQYYEAPDALEAAFGHELTEDDWAAVGKFMTTCLEMKHGAPLVSLNITNPLLRELEAEMKNEQRKLSFFCAHDCTVLGTLSALGATLDALPDSIETKTPIGVKLMFERLRDREGRAWYRASLVYRSTEQIRSAEILTPDNPPMKYVLGFEGVETNEDGLIAEEDLFSLFDRSIGALDELESAYAPEDAA